MVISHKTLNFLTPPPVLLEAKEEIHKDYMTITQLYKLVDELKAISNANSTIETLRLQQYLMEKQLFSFDIPETMSALDIH